MVNMGMENDLRRWMRLVESTILPEAVFYKGTFKQKYSPLESNIVVLKDPSRSEFTRFHAGSTYQEVRGLLEDDLLIWDSFIATHSDVAAFFKVDGADLHLGLDQITMNDCPDDWTDEEAEKTAQWIKTHPAILRLYGADVSVSLEAPDNGNTWHF
jgi:hypothetical protein